MIIRTAGLAAARADQGRIAVAHGHGTREAGHGGQETGAGRGHIQPGRADRQNHRAGLGRIDPCGPGAAPPQAGDAGHGPVQIGGEVAGTVLGLGQGDAGGIDQPGAAFRAAAVHAEDRGARHTNIISIRTRGSSAGPKTPSAMTNPPPYSPGPHIKIFDKPLPLVGDAPWRPHWVNRPRNGDGRGVHVFQGRASRFSIRTARERKGGLGVRNHPHPVPPHKGGIVYLTAQSA